MKQLKKTILTLALLIAATTQAWATDYLYLDISSDGKSATICYGDPEGKPYLDPDQTWMISSINYWDINYEIRSLITTVTFDKSCQTFNGKSLKGLFFYFQNLITINGINNLCTDKVENMAGMFDYCHDLATLDLSSFNTANVTNMSTMFKACEEMTTVDLSSFNTAKVTNMQNMFQSCYELKTIYVSDDWSTAKVEKSTEMFNNCKKLPGYKDSGPEYWDKRKATLTTDGGYLTYKAPGTPVATPATDATKTSLSLTQPTGNVTISVKYYDQAEFADGLAPAAITGVQASTADPIVTPGTPKTIGTSDVKMGTVMYHASQTALTDADLLALGTDDWSSSVPKATNLGTGDAYVYYYIQGAEPASGNAADRSDANTCSDSDIKAANVVNVTLIAPPTYDVSLNKTGLATGEPANWKAKSETVTTEVNLGEKDLEGVTKGETVTVTYTGSRKVIGVKAQKCVLLNISSPAFGHVIGIDGKNYAYDALPPAVTAVAMICHVDGEHGLALALADEGQMNWEDAMKNAAAHKPAFIGGTWKLPTMEEWDKMISAAGSPVYLRSGFSEVGGNDLLTKDYWSSTEDENNNLLAKSFNFLYYFRQSNDKTNGFYVRACLAF